MDSGGTECARVRPLILGANVGHSNFLVDLGDVDLLQLLVHIVKEIGEEVTGVLLLSLGVVHLEEGLEDAFGVNHSLSEKSGRVELVTVIEVFADMNKLLQQSIRVQAILDLRVLSYRLQ